MSNIAIKVEGVSKQYRLGEITTGSLAHDVNKWWHTLRGKENPYLKVGESNNRTVKSSSEYVWALQDVSFDVEQGAVLGIIGRNGAGKSTLLKLLSRTTLPTTGTIKAKGRIASLLEVGTGFHPDLSGRDNIFLNGAILGMTKSEIRSKFDEIVDFAGVEKYIDTPVKRYSSGMYVRLAFAVAAHLDPEILIVDEVLAVGDAEFQKKCLGKMKDVSVEQGRTVLFVSHNMGAINQLCTQAIFMAQGKLVSIGKTDRIIGQYFGDNDSDSRPYKDYGVRSGKKAYLSFIGIGKEGDSEYSSEFSIGDGIQFSFSIMTSNPNEKNIKTAIELKTSEGVRIANMIDVDSQFQVSVGEPGIYRYKVVLKDVRLYPGMYFVSFYIGDMSSVEPYDYLEDALRFEILDGGVYTTRVLPRSAGLFFLTPEWSQVN